MLRNGACKKREPDKHEVAKGPAGQRLRRPPGFNDGERQRDQGCDGKTKRDEPERSDRLHRRRLGDEAGTPDGAGKQQE
ncbi:hypothetical protein D3C86_2154310 [compost metagenome]